MDTTAKPLSADMFSDEEQAKFWAKIDLSESDPEVRAGMGPCWPWTGGKFTRGYGNFWSMSRCWGAHKVMHALVNGPVSKGQVVRHACDVTACCRPSHLLVGAPADNNRDMIERGRHRAVSGDQHPFRMQPGIGPHGEGHGLAKLNDAAVLRIRERTDLGPSALGREYGVSETAIRCVRQGRTWRHVKAPQE